MPVRQSVQPVVVEIQSTNNAILEASQPLSARFDGMSNRVDAVEQGLQPLPLHLHGRNDAGTLSLPSSGLPIPNKVQIRLLGMIPMMMVRVKMMMNKD